MKEKIYEDWSIDQMYEGICDFESLTKSLQILCDLHEKHKFDESISGSIDAMREEICGLFGGSIYKK